jgi:hypothetical protein
MGLKTDLPRPFSQPVAVDAAYRCSLFKAALTALLLALET